MVEENVRFAAVLCLYVQSKCYVNKITLVK
jgi:hypothetical protein